MTKELFLAVFLSLAPAASAQDGRAVSCGCYCGVSLPPPCSDNACISACGGSPTYATTGTSEPPMQGVHPGRWSKHFVGKYKENIDNCGPKPLCMGLATVVYGITVPIGLVVDLPVFLVKGIGTGGYYLGRGLTWPFRAIANRPKKPAHVVEIVAPPPPAKPAVDCSGLSAEQDKLTAELKTDSEAFNAAIVKSQLDQGVDAAKGAVTEASDVAKKASDAKDAKELADWLAGLNAGIESCRTSQTASDAWHKCIEALYSTYDQSLGKIADATKVEAAKSALKDYVGKVISKTEPLIQKAAACQAR